MRVLVVEADPATSRTLELMLSHANINAYCTDLGEDAIDLAQVYDYDLITLDLNLPDMSGFEVLRQLRLKRIETPVLILTDSDDIESKIKAFGAGADDCLTKPFHREELVARIQAIVRRSKGHSQSKIQVGPIRLNIADKTAEVDGKPLHLTGKEYSLVELMALRRGTTMTKEMLLSHLYGGIDEPEMKIIDVFVCKVRKKLAEVSPGAEKHIATVWGRGYVMREGPAEAEASAP